jgi:serine/threonine-protein kinase
MDSANLDTPPATPSPPVSTESGRVIAQRYRLIKKLGEGAMGAVFLAEHIHMRKRFALKILLPEAMASPEIVARFEREAIAAGNIEHPGVCAATDFGRLDDGGFFLVLEYVDGQSLRAINRAGPMSPSRACGIARQILAALAAAHAKGVVHRDMKPENVMIIAAPNGDEVVKVLDFGIAKVDANTLGEGQGTNLTRMGAIYGTPVYMAPEQAMGKAIDARVDLYAVGVMLHEMITGKPPFDGDGIVLLAKHVNDEPPPLVSPLDPNAVTPALRRFAERMLAKQPEDRPEDANRAIAELEEARSSLTSYRPVELAMHPTLMGETSILTGRPTGGPIADAATMHGSPAPPSVVAGTPVKERARALKDRALVKLAPLAKRAGVDVRHLAIGLTCLAGMFLVLLMVVAFSGPAKTDDEEDERRPRKRSVPTAQTATNDDSPGKTAPTASPSGSGSGGKGGGGIKGLGRKIKSLF